tara:strand:- start:2329 stop:2604 length:276 start_codon:yes stop_codon:yes gene_type:complete
MTSDKQKEYNTLLEMWREEKKKRIEAEEALTKALVGDHRVAESDKIIMKKMEEIEKLKADLAREKEDRQYDKMVHERELADLFRGKYDKGK